MAQWDKVKIEGECETREMAKQTKNREALCGSLISRVSRSLSMENTGMRGARRLGWSVLTVILIAAFITIDFSSAANGPLQPPDGAALFAAKCAKCHGQDGRGIPKYLKKGQKDFTDDKWQKSRTDAQLTKVILEGKGDFMPPWKEKLSTEEIKTVVGQIRVFGKNK